MYLNICQNENYHKDKKKAIVEGFIQTDAKYLKKFEDDGSTALVAILTDQNDLWVAHAGSYRLMRSDLRSDQVIQDA